MDRFEDSDALFFEPPAAVRRAWPLIERFIRSGQCPLEHRWHARTTLPVLALFVAMSSTQGASDALHWGELDPGGLLRATFETAPEEREFLRDLLDVSASFYAFLGREGILAPSRASDLRETLVRLALGMCPR